MIRLKLCLQLVLCTLCPPYAMWSYKQWTGRWPEGGMMKWWWNAAKFAFHHTKSAPDSVGLNAVRWGSPPVRSAQALERKDHKTPGSCGDCFNCCTTYWMGKDAVVCPFLRKGKCSIYGSQWWDYFNCGRFPEKPAQIDAYACPRFEIKKK